MDIISLILISVGLAMDCLAVSISKGICVRKIYIGYTLRMAFLFGLFQALMPLIGFFVGKVFAEQIKSVDHWIALILLAFIGIRMIVEARGKSPYEIDCSGSVASHFKIKELLPLAVATSIDALATGVILISFPEFIWKAILVIGSTSFLFSFIGMFIGTYFGKRFHFKVEILGGVILIFIGLKIWVEHMFF